MNKYLLALFVLFSILNISKVNADAQRVITLTDRNFDDLVLNNSDNDIWFIEFYAPWCGHCKSLTPHWERLGEMFKDEPNIKIAKLDADSEKNVGGRFGVNSFPQIKMLTFGKKSINKAIDYNGPRDAEAMEQYVLDEKNTKMPARFEQIVDQNTYNQFCVNIKRGACVIAFVPHIYDSSAVERNGYLERVRAVAEKHKTSHVTFSWSQGGDQYEFEEALNLGTGYPAVIAVSNTKQVYAIMKGSFTQERIESFVSGLLSGKESLSKFRQGIPKIKKVDPWDGQDKKQESYDDYDDL